MPPPLTVSLEAKLHAEAAYTESLEFVSIAGENLRQARSFYSTLQLCGRWLLRSDIAALMLAFLCGGIVAWAVNIYWLKGSFQTLRGMATLKQFLIFSGLGALSLLWLDTRGHYRQRLPYWEGVGHILCVSIIGFCICGFIQFAAQGSFSRLWLGLSWCLFGLFLFIGRGRVRKMLIARNQWEVRALLIGSGEAVQSTLRALKREPRMGFSITATIPAQRLLHLTKPDTWKMLMRTHGASHIFLALDGMDWQIHAPALSGLARERLPCSIVPPWSGLPTSTMSSHHFMLHDVLLLHDTNRLCLPLPRFLKRSFDIVVAGLALLLLMPVFFYIGFKVRRDGGKALFKQERIGRGGKRFACYKFRSMHVDAEHFLERYLEEDHNAREEWSQFQKLKKDIRITEFGDFLRRTSLDELPQLLNVIKGDMSLVGPRPILPGQEHFYADDFIYYESVRPGLTGPWQVSGRNALTFKERVALEACYTRNWSLWMDIVILLKTFPVVLKREEAY